MDWIKEYLHILQCPFCGGDLGLQNNKLICKNCNKKYPIKDNIPIFLEDDIL
ncbi:Trm112 family protein [Methanococcus aeolicus]|uniref:Trm112 family protein n=1 Tax=Methanococcus aeolicus TaxID=42879 RepID=UPI0003220675|nr:Trm112 family protein [Methanococcus aeolicus]UXM84574.1 Trm112 family protein [Methanococcus aeolicus]